MKLEPSPALPSLQSPPPPSLHSWCLQIVWVSRPLLIKQLVKYKVGIICHCHGHSPRIRLPLVCHIVLLNKGACGQGTERPQGCGQITVTFEGLFWVGGGCCFSSCKSTLVNYLRTVGNPDPAITALSHLGSW